MVLELHSRCKVDIDGMGIAIDLLRLSDSQKPVCLAGLHNDHTSGIGIPCTCSSVLFAHREDTVCRRSLSTLRCVSQYRSYYMQILLMHLFSPAPHILRIWCFDFFFVVKKMLGHEVIFWPRFLTIICRTCFAAACVFLHILFLFAPLQTLRLCTVCKRFHLSRPCCAISLSW